ncbi:MAG TPA: serine hydrolase [Candidatus Sulfotelmatobacter sp.]|nr:serine hydrolase [Candidatus Sulfotelmatobacter sp.]
MRSVLSLLLTAALPFAAVAAGAQGVDGSRALAGLWRAVGTVGPPVDGELVVRAHAGRWTASIDGLEATGRTAGTIRTFRFPAGFGELHAPVSPGASMRAFWIQPAGATFGNRYGSPADLRLREPDTWVGQVVTLPSRLELYLVLQPGPQGGLRGFVRDPLANFGPSFASARLDGTTLRFTGAHGGFAGAYDPATQTIALTIAPYPPAIFTRVAPSAASGFFPRTPMRSHLAYERPLPRADGWPVGTLAQVGMRPAPVEALLDHILRTPDDSLRAPVIQGLLVARHGRLVVDAYFDGFSADRPHDLRSAGKSFDAALVGTAIAHGAALRADTPILPFYRFGALRHPDPRKAHITLGDVLDMSSGLRCDDNDDASPGNEGVVQSQAGQPDWYRYMLDLPMASAPGVRAVYCSEGINLVGGVVSHATAVWLPLWFDRTIARPLQFGRYYIPITPTGTMYLGGGEYLLPRDFLKLGQLFLDGGRWHGVRLLPHAWVTDALRPHASLQTPGDYGYSWHRLTLRVGRRTYRSYEAGGNGGQLLEVVPQLDLVVLVTAANYMQYPVWKRFRDLIAQDILAASAP